MKRKWSMVIFLILLFVFYGLYTEKIENSNKMSKESISKISLNTKELNEIKDLFNGDFIEKGFIYEIQSKTRNTQKLVPILKNELGVSQLKIYLIDDENNIEKLKDFYGNQWVFHGLLEIHFEDLNADGLNDLIIIGEAMTGIGTNGAKPFKVASVYFQSQNRFANLEAIDDALNTSITDIQLTEIKKYILKQDIDLKSN